ncbi:MAG: inorganic phosphate transporter [Akkermansia sp.]|nr:inorganic phosphate transporter [Akkermansia sp.]
MDTTYYVIYGMLLLLSVFGLVVGVSNDACNFLNSSIGSRAGTYTGAVAVAAVGVLLGASFSSGMMEIARSGVFIPSMFSFHEVMLLFLAVMVANVILLDTFNTLGLPTSTTVSLIFALLGSALGMAYFNLGDGPGSIADYINTDKVFFIISGIFCSVAIAFTVGTIVMWFARLLYTFHFQRMYRLIGPLWCGFAFTAISYFAVFKGLKTSPVMKGAFMDMVDANLGLAILVAFIAWSIIAAILQYGLKINTLRLTVLAGTGALALAFAGNDLVNFIGVFMASQTTMQIGEAHLAAGGDLATLKMSGLADVKQQVNMLWLVAAGLIMVATLFFSKKARKVTETELKLSAASTGKERFGSCAPARTMVRYTLNTVRFFEKITPMPVQNFIARRFTPLAPEEETGALYDQVRGSVNLTVSALLISVATDLQLPLSTTYVTFMVAMGSSLADRAWGRDSAVYRITGVLTVIGGWFLTALAACLAAFAVALIMAYGGFWGMISMLVIAGILLIKSTFFTNSAKEEIRLINMQSEAAVKDFGKAASGRLGRMVGIYKAMVKALLNEDRDALKRLRKKTRTLKRDLEVLRENEVLPTLRTLPKELADRGQLVFRITEISINTCERLFTLVKASYNHIDNNHQGLNKEQADDLLALTNKIGRFYPDLTDMLKAGNYAGIEALLEDRDQLSEDFADCITRHLMHSTADESGMRNGILYLTLLNETRAMISHAFALIERVKELYKD